MASIEPEPSKEPESDPFASYCMTPEQIQAHDKAEAKRQAQELAKQAASPWCDPTVSKAAALAGLSSAASTAFAPADVFSTLGSVADLQTCKDYVADLQLLEHARLVGINVDKMPAGTLRGLGIDGLFALKQQQDNAKQMEQVLGSLSASANVSAVLAGLPSAASSISAMPSLSDTFSAHSTVAGWQARASAVDAVSAAVTALGPSADAYQLSKAIAIGIDVDKIPAGTLRGLGTDGLLMLWQEQELSKQMASLRGDLSASAGISSALAGLTSTTSAASAMVDIFGSVSAVASISDAMDAIARHSSGFESAWLSVHAGGVDQYAKELTHLIQPLASIREAVGTWDGVQATQFDHLAGTSTYLQASGFPADALLRSALEPANRDAEPDVITRRFLRTLEDGDRYTEIIPIQPLPAWVHSPVQPPAKADDEKRVESLKSKLRKSNAKRKKAEACANDAWAMVAKLSVALESMAVQVSKWPAITSPVAQAGAEIVQTTIDPAMAERRMRVGEIQSVQPLERYSTIDHVTRWLLVATGRPWSLTELVNSLTPVIHLDRSSDLDAMFGKRLEGYLCPMVYEGDRQRLISSNEPLLTMTSLTDLDATARLIRFEPGIPFCRSEVRFAGTDVESLAAEVSDGRTVPDVQRAKAPMQRREAQDDAILQAIRAASHDPKRLPKATAGKPGIKAAVRTAVGDGRGMFTGSTVFEKAWERLRKAGEISDA